MSDDTATSRKPIFLLADSQLLLMPEASSGIHSAIQRQIGVREAKVTRAAYIGASNRDDPAFFQMFVAAMDRIDTHDSRMIPSEPSPEDRRFLDDAELVLLAGGDVGHGWGVLQENGVAEAVATKYMEGAVLIGVSAGAVQLGIGAHTESVEEGFTEMLKLVPHFIDAHDEANDWQRLHQTVGSDRGFANGLGLPAGGGLIYHPDGTLEPVRYPVGELSPSGDRVTSTMLFPPEAEESAT